MKEDDLAIAFQRLEYEKQKPSSGIVVGGVNAKAKNRKPPFDWREKR